MTAEKQTQSFEFKAEMKQLLHLLIHSLYTHPEVFLRELISNASDALSKARFYSLSNEVLNAESELKISIEIDKDKKSFKITDTGIGMTRDELINNIGTVARSGTLEYLKAMQSENKDAVENLIGQFGVGFYSVFMVTDQVTVETRHADKDSVGYRWQSDGEGSYIIEEIEKEDRGTTISFTLNASAEDFAEEFRVKSVIEKYSNFADFPIYLGEEKVNNVAAVWRKSSNEITDDELKEFYKFISNDFEEPLGHLHLSLEGASVNFKSLVFIPKKAPFDLLRNVEDKGLHLYSNKIMIQRECKELLPDYLRFVKGVVDTIDLPLNVSREVTQNSPVMEKIRSIITKKILGELKNWADTDKEKYKTFYENFGKLLATGVNSDFTNREKILELLRFETSKEAATLVSLKDYVERMSSEQKEIYYLSGETRDGLERNPNLEYFKKHDIEVFFLTDPVDVFIFPSIGEFEGKKIKSADTADLDLKPEEKIEKPDSKVTQDVLKLFKEVLADEVEDVVESKRLVDSAVTLVSGKNGMDPQMERMMKMMNKDHVSAKKVLEVNTSHPIVSNISRKLLANADIDVAKNCIRQLYDGALLIDGELQQKADFVKRMNDFLLKATQ